jgi:hypothetical protein
MWNHLLPTDSCIICGRKCFETESGRCSGADKLLCDKWVENNKDDIVKQQIENLQQRIKAGLPALDELRIVNRRGLYLGGGEFAYHSKTDTFWRCFNSGTIPLLQSERWEKVIPKMTFYSQYNASMEEILKKRLFEEKNEGEWPPDEIPKEIKTSSEEFTEIEYESVSGFSKVGPFSMKYATSASY